MEKRKRGDWLTRQEAGDEPWKSQSKGGRRIKRVNYKIWKKVVIRVKCGACDSHFECWALKLHNHPLSQPPFSLFLLYFSFPSSKNHHFIHLYYWLQNGNLRWNICCFILCSKWWRQRKRWDVGILGLQSFSIVFWAWKYGMRFLTKKWKFNSLLFSSSVLFCRFVMSGDGIEFGLKLAWFAWRL